MVLSLLGAMRDESTDFLESDVELGVITKDLTHNFAEIAVRFRGHRQRVNNFLSHLLLIPKINNVINFKFRNLCFF